jgi:hypothetical protein
MKHMATSARRDGAAGGLHTWAWRALVVGAVAAVYVAAYGRFVGRFFSFDDFAVLTAVDGIHVRTPFDVLRFFAPWPNFALYRPLTTVGYFWTAWAVLGLDPARWSLAQIGFHVVNALLVCAIASRLLGSRPAGLAAALVYASAPGHALAVRWSAFFTITGTTLVYFVGLWAWLRAAERWRVPATLAIFVIGLMCSEHAVSFPAALTAIAVLGQGRRDGRRLARELAPFWLVGSLYVGAKLFFLRVLAPRLNPLQARLFRVAYALSFDPLPALDRLGRYVAAVAPPLYAPEHSATWYRGAGALTVGLAAALVTASWLAGSRRPRLGVTACGVVLFLVGLAPVLFLARHVFPAYIGIAALGASLAIVAPLTALRRGNAMALAVAAAFVAVHLEWTAAAVRSEEDFRNVDGLGILAARWLRAVEQAAGPGTREVVVPLDEVTVRMFGVAHRLFLCAPYEVRPVADLESVPAQPDVVIVRVPAEAGPDALHDWRSIVRRCPR